MTLLHKINRWRRSWTVNWGLLLQLVGYFHDNIAQVMPAIKRVIPNDEVGAFVMAIGMVVIVLRFKTTKPLAER